MDLTYLNATNNLPEKERKIKIANSRNEEEKTPEQMTQKEKNWEKAHEFLTNNFYFNEESGEWCCSDSDFYDVAHNELIDLLTN